MAGNQGELSPTCGDSTVSEVVAAGFEGCRDYYSLHPIFNVDEVGTREHSDNEALHQFPRGQSSKTRVRRKHGAMVLGSASSECTIIVDDEEACDFDASPGRVKKLGSRHKSEARLGRVCRSLAPGKLDSKQFEFHLEKLWGRFPEEKTDGFAHIDSLWFSLYRKQHYKAKVLMWIKNKAIFSKKYVFVPIVLWSHWFLLILCHFGENPYSNNGNRCMLLLDSLNSTNTLQLKPCIRSFLVDIFKTENRQEEEELIRNVPLYIPKVPQQKGKDDCGFFVLYYINLFLECAFVNGSVSMGYPDFIKEDWFNSDDIECFVKGLE